MINYYVARDGELGFGVNREEAEKDLIINLCRHSLNYDSSGVYMKRRRELNPWMPNEYMLHITGVGCLMYKNGVLYNTANNKSMQIIQTQSTMYYYLAGLVGDLLSYEDICVVLREELDTLFHNISKDFISLAKMPYIKILGETNGFSPSVIYSLQSGFDIGIADDIVGIKRTDDALYHAIELSDLMPYIPTLSYIGYKLGIVLTKEGVVQGGVQNT